MLTKRLIACFDIIGDRVTKAYKFQNNIDIDSAEKIAESMYCDQIDEIIFYDIKASAEKRKINLDIVNKVAEKVFVPFTVGGGIKDLETMYEVLKAGAEKISLDSMAVRNPKLLSEGAKAFGSQCMVLSIQVKRRVGSNGDFPSDFPSGYEVAIDGARTFTGKDALEWAKEGVRLGAGEIVVNSIDRDGTHTGYDLDILKQISEAVSVPVIASGGAGEPSHIVDAFQKTEATAAIISSMLYSPRLTRNYTPKELKLLLIDTGINARPWVELN